MSTNRKTRDRVADARRYASTHGNVPARGLEDALSQQADRIAQLERELASTRDCLAQDGEIIQAHHDDASDQRQRADKAEAERDGEREQRRSAAEQVAELQAEVERLRHDLLGGDMALANAYDRQEAEIARLRDVVRDLLARIDEMPNPHSNPMRHYFNQMQVWKDEAAEAALGEGEG